ncbi:hypothetical protein HYPSUDRAFT_202101 [Hypholoma sublateritium FD-334 SS-4]|uniref:Uncharacterized protein n=1 Tax=Hypholoma sublateritium (strain FD-334 SS-4) TaxID=945553 RepID=A0A0D2L6F3_HYPSF|nr:hypothetical protein HYPSUDRAFT_202101 [Hypholoma sublateritium FD-334 SS-4]
MHRVSPGPRTRRWAHAAPSGRAACAPGAFLQVPPSNTREAAHGAPRVHVANARYPAADAHPADAAAAMRAAHAADGRPVAPRLADG